MDSKFFVLEWSKDSNSEDYSLKVTPHESTETALQQTQDSAANHHCVSTVNPLTGEGEEKK